MQPLQVVFSLAGIVVIIVACYYTTYYIGKKASGQSHFRTSGKSMSINLRERFAISKDKSFCVVEMAGKIYFIGVTNQSMVLLDTLDPEKLAGCAAGRDEMPAWGMVPDGLPGGKLVNRLASFMAQRMGKARGMGADGGKGSGEFAESMRSARERSDTGQTDRVNPERPDDPEVK